VIFIQLHQVADIAEISPGETSWRVAKKKSCLWVGATSDCTFFNIDPSPRSAETYKHIVGSFRGTPATGYSVYNQHPGCRQSCLAHIGRSPKWSKEKGSMHFPGKTSQKELGKIICIVARIQSRKVS